MRKIFLIVLDILLGIIVFGGLLAFGFVRENQQPALLVVLVLGTAFLVVLRVVFDQKKSSAPHSLVSSQPSHANKDSASEGRDDQPLFVLKPSPDSPRRRSPRSIFIVGALWPIVFFALIILMVFIWRIDVGGDVFIWIGMAVVAASLFFMHRYVSARGGYDISYEFYERGLKYNYMEYGLDGQTAPKKRTISLPYFEIRGVELAPRSLSSDDKFVDIHVIILTPERRKIMCGSFSPNKEFFLYDIPATEHPIRRIRELLESYHEKNPRADEFAAMLGAT